MFNKKYAFLICLTVVLFMTASELLADEIQDARGKVPKLQGVLKELNDNFDRGALTANQNIVRSRKLFVEDGKIRVMLMLRPGMTLDESVLSNLGVEVERRHNGFWRVLAPTNALRRMAQELDAVSYIRTPQRPIPEYTGQGPGLTNADAWISAGYGGSGVSVAVIDGSYGYLSTVIGNGDIPAGYTQVNYTSGAFSGGTSEFWHGTSVAEILMDMAPDCDLTLIKIDDESDLATAKDYCITNGIQVINTSFGYYNLGDYAGNGILCDVVNDAYNNGIFWVKSAGNNQQTHYKAPYSDPDANNWHNFSPSDETNTLSTNDGSSTSLGAGWDINMYLYWDWPTTAQDYDLYLYRVGSATPVASSTNPQTGSEPGTEEIEFTIVIAGSYYFKIENVSATGTEELTVHVPGYQLEHRHTESSFSQPADAEGCFAVGALHQCSWPGGAAVEDYSSFGPTLDGRIKPDIVAPTMVDLGFLTHCACNCGFGGTSGAAPHAAGAAALVIQANPSFTVAQVWAYLESNAIDKGAAGKDNEWGAGLLNLPDPNGGEECDQPILSLVGYSEVSWADPLWEVQVEVMNHGPGVAANVTVTMNTDIPWLVIPDPNCNYGDIPDGGSSWGMDSYTFDLTATPGGNFNVWFDVTYNDACGNPYMVTLDPEFEPTDRVADATPNLAYQLSQNYPNPFNPNTTIRYQIPADGRVNLKIYDVMGRLVRTLTNEFKVKGNHAAYWDGKDNQNVNVSSGIYFYKLMAGTFVETKRMVLLR